MRWARFLAFNALGAALWVGLWASVGYLAGGHLTALYGQLRRYEAYLAIVVAVVMLAALGRWLWRRHRHRTRTEPRPEHDG